MSHARLQKSITYILPNKEDFSGIVTPFEKLTKMYLEQMLTENVHPGAGTWAPEEVPSTEKAQFPIPKSHGSKAQVEPCTKLYWQNGKSANTSKTMREFWGEFSSLIRSEIITKGFCHTYSRHDLVCYYIFIWFHSEQPCFITMDSTVPHSPASFLPRQILQEINLTHLLPW